MHPIIQIQSTHNLSNSGHLTTDSFSNRSRGRIELEDNLNKLVRLSLVPTKPTSRAHDLTATKMISSVPRGRISCKPGIPVDPLKNARGPFEVCTQNIALHANAYRERSRPKREAVPKKGTTGYSFDLLQTAKVRACGETLPHAVQTCGEITSLRDGVRSSTPVCDDNLTLLPIRFGALFRTAF